MKRLCMTVLSMEAVVVCLAVPVADHLGHLAAHSAWLVAGVAVAAAVLLCGAARRALAVTLVGGSMLQIFLVAAGHVVPVMYFLGGIFAFLWALGIWLGYRVEHAVSQ